MKDSNRPNDWNPPESHCIGKESFSTFKLANEVAKRKRRNDAHLEPYKCPTCKEYHVANRQGRFRR